MASQRYTVSEFRLIESHCLTVVGAAESALMTLRQIPKANRADQVVGQMLYWKHVIAGMKFAIEQARQRVAGVNSVR